MAWLTQDTINGVHVLPLDDSQEHAQHSNCPCHPHVHLVDATCCHPYQFVRKVITHHGFDGRPDE